MPKKIQWAVINPIPLRAALALVEALEVDEPVISLVIETAGDEKTAKLVEQAAAEQGVMLYRLGVDE